MTLRTIPRVALGAALRALRFPLDRALTLTGEETSASVKLAVDRAEVAVRGAAASVLGDPELGRDADRRRRAADERARALRLRAEAQYTSQEAERAAQERKRRADEHRGTAAERSRAKRRNAAERRDRTKSSASEVAARRTAAAEKDAARKKDAAKEDAKRTRLDQLEKKAGALEDREAAVTSAAEADRLREAATAAKAMRKRR
jgi:colicin import membrane protein